jgi:hypothetical protein
MLVSAVLASLALMGGAQEPARFCPQPQPQSKPPSRIERYMKARRQFGFRGGKAYVRKLIRRGMWAYGAGSMPATAREKRYLRLRDRLALGAAASRYLIRRPNLSGGVSIEDDWPRGPYMLVRLTRDRPLHTRRLKRLARFPRNLRTARVQVSERELSRIQDRIDFDAHEPEGFHIAGTTVDIYTGTVAIDLITRRTDHLEYFRARYGPYVRTYVIATELTSPECAEILSYRTAPDGLSLQLRYASGGGATFDHVELAEYDDRVELGVVEQGPNGPRTADYRVGEATVALSRPLGARTVIDATTGKRVRPRR